MSRTLIARYVNPWKFRRELEQQRLQGLRQRDGDDCRRCRRPLRFDLPSGHDWGPSIQQVLPPPPDGPETLDHLCLTHRRCTAEAADHTSEVQERVRRKSEAALLSRSRVKRRA